MLIDAYILPSGALFGLTTLLSGVNYLQRISLYFLQSSFGLGRIRLTVGQFFLTICVARFVFQCFYVKHCQDKLTRYEEGLAQGSVLATSEVEDRLKRGVWRAERDFWIVLLTLGLWMVYVRASQILSVLNHKILTLRMQQSEPHGGRKGVETPPTEESEQVSSVIPSKVEKEKVSKRRC